MKKTLLYCFLLSYGFMGYSQHEKDRFSFAKSYFGIDINYVPSYGESSFLNDQGNIQSFTRGSYFDIAPTIGGTHFWGHADFYVSLSAGRFNLKEDNIIENSTRLGAFTGFRIYPWKIVNYKIRPYIGYKFSGMKYSQSTIDKLSFSKTHIKSTIDLGIGYMLPNSYVYLGFNTVHNAPININVSKEKNIATTLPRHFINFGIAWMVENTKLADTENNRKQHTKNSNSNKNGIYLGIGPSGVYPTRKSSYILNQHPYLNDKELPNLFPDFAFGYHFSKQDVIMGTAFRSMKQVREDGGRKLTVKRNSLALEIYKFIGDFHGFVPFIGGGINFENLNIDEHDKNESFTKTKNLFTPNITFGWDIRPAKSGDWWYLRTNLRYSPGLKFNIKNDFLSLQHLEFNFIQFVIYPQRLASIKRSEREHKKD